MIGMITGLASFVMGECLLNRLHLKRKSGPGLSLPVIVRGWYKSMFERLKEMVGEFVFHNKILKRGFRIWLDGKKLGFGPSIWGSGEQMEILTDKAPTNGLNQYDQLHILVEGRTITVFLNGEQCGAPVELDFDLGRHDVAPGIVSDTNFTKVEFERILWFALTKNPEPKNPEQEFKTTDKRLIDLLNQEPVDVQEFDFNRDLEKDGAFFSFCSRWSSFH